jgi:hypothetical protein
MKKYKWRIYAILISIWGALYMYGITNGNLWVSIPCCIILFVLINGMIVDKFTKN